MKYADHSNLNVKFTSTITENATRKYLFSSIEHKKLVRNKWIIYFHDFKIICMLYVYAISNDINGNISTYILIAIEKFSNVIIVWVWKGECKAPVTTEGERISRANHHIPALDPQILLTNMCPIILRIKYITFVITIPACLLTINITVLYSPTP